MQEQELDAMLLEKRTGAQKSVGASGSGAGAATDHTILIASGVPMPARHTKPMKKTAGWGVGGDSSRWSGILLAASAPRAQPPQPLHASTAKVPHTSALGTLLRHTPEDGLVVNHIKKVVRIMVTPAI